MTMAAHEYHDQGMVGNRPVPVLCTTMKTTLLTLVAISLAVMAQAQTPVTVSTAPQNADQVWYSMANGEVARAPLAEWDLAFQISGFESSILVNTAKGNKVYHTGAGIADWATITAPDEDAWTELNNSETNWAEGALTYGNTLGNDGFNLGWGTYNMTTHAVVGTEVYAVQLDGTTWKKLRIDGLVGGTYAFTYANLDGSEEVNGALVKTNFAGKVFGYWDMTTNAAVDREPAAADWDLVFTKYLTDLGVMWYGVAGILQNSNVEVAQLDGVDPVNTSWLDADGQFSTEINTIGSDWKSYINDEYVYPEDRVYFVKDVPGNIWKIVFTGYGGGATGDMSFNQEMVSTVGIDEQGMAQASAHVYPNPVRDGQAQVVLDLPAAHSVARVFNSTGQQVLEQQWSGHLGLSTRTLDVHGLAKGIYLLRIDTDRSNITAKLVVE